MDELLEILAKRSYCFISDLKTKENCKSLLPVLRAIHEEKYSLSAWQDAFHYIAETSPKGKDVKAIKQEMIHHLESK